MQCRIHLVCFKFLNSNSLTLKKLNSISKSLTLQKSNSNLNSSILSERIQIQIQSNPSSYYTGVSNKNYDCTFLTCEFGIIAKF